MESTVEYFVLFGKSQYYISFVFIFPEDTQFNNEANDFHQ